MSAYQSERIDEVAKALAKAQAELNPATKNSTNPHLKNRYADIAAVWDALRSVLPSNGLAVTQTLIPSNDNKVTVRTTLMHESGQWIAGECALPCPQQTPQGYGSAITYARRYSLSAMVGVVSEEDDDGNGAQKTEVGRGRQPAPGGQSTPPAPKPDGKNDLPDFADGNKVQRIQMLLKEMGLGECEERISRVNDWLVRNKAMPVESTNELTNAQADQLIRALEKKINEAAQAKQ